MKKFTFYFFLVTVFLSSQISYSQGGCECDYGSATLVGPSCYIVNACSDPSATNYCAGDIYLNENCIYDGATGCTCEDATNYDPDATSNDGSCVFMEGCSDINAANYTDCSGATVQTESCEYTGCTCPLAYNYDSSASVDDGSCVVVSDGCGDSAATNYSGDECANSLFLAENCEYDNVSYDDLDWTYINTGTNATIAYYPTTLTFNEAAIPNGSLVGLFYTNDSGNFVCGGYQEINNDEGAQSIAAWGTEVGLDNGFALGEPYTVFLQIYGQTFIAESVSWNTSPPFSDTYAINGFGQIQSASFVGEITGVPGCTDNTAANYNSEATFDDGSCYNLEWEYVNTGSNATVLINTPGNITLNGDPIPLCASIGVFYVNDSGQYMCGGYSEWTGETMSIAAWGSEAGEDNGFAIGESYTWFVQIGNQSFPVDASGSNMSTTPPFSDTYALNAFASLLSANFIGEFGELVYGCDDNSACNYDETVNCNDNSCTYPESGYDCEGNCLTDTDGDGICDELEIAGCVDSEACNYDDIYTDEDNSTCVYPPQYYNCAGVCINDTNNNGICDELDDPGCTDSEACNYDANASADDGSCTYPSMWYWDTDGDGLGDDYFEMESCTQPGPEFVDNIDDPCINDPENDADGDGICESDEIFGCDDNNACNYNELATENNGSCIYPTEDYLDCSGLCINDIDGDFICDELEIPGCQDASSCNYNAAATDDDGSCYFVSLWYADIDGDGLGDPNDSSVSCDQPEGFVSDNTDLCPLDIENDADGDGVCESNEIFGCTDINACNYNENATEENNSCTYIITACDTCESGVIINNDDDNDGVCNNDEIAGCTDIAYIEYNPNATDDDGSCETLSADGCIDPSACNYNAYATDDDGSCVYPSETYLNCEESCINDTDGDGVCDEIEILGCTDTLACNYNNEATNEDGSCIYPSETYLNCEGNCINDADGDSVCDEIEILGCTDSSACNYDDNPTTDSDNTLCTYPSETYLNCEESCINDTDGDGVCDEIEILGCTDVSACNYDILATDDNGDCYNNDLGCGCDTPAAETGYDCDGNCLIDTDDDGICDEFEILGCTDVLACNYDNEATDENGNCTYPSETYLNCEGNCINDSDSDGVCDELEVLGCTDSSACNYDENPTTDSDITLCTYPSEIYLNCEESCINDTDGDGICNEIEVLGCADEAACNYNPNSTDIGECIYTDGICESCENGIIIDNDQDDDGICDANEIAGCINPYACNYNANATDDDESCWYPSSFYVDCNEVCYNDTDGDGVCDELEIPGCTDESACNFDPDLGCTDDNGTCIYAVDFYDCDGNPINDADGDFIPDELEVEGCMDPGSCNYDIEATDPAECFLQEMIVIDYSTTDVSCYGGNDGSCTIIIGGGNSEYTALNLQTDEETIQDEDAFNFTNLAVGEYEILFTDVNGCFITQTIYIYGPENMSIDWVVTPVSCNGESDGSAIPVISGGAGEYNITEWVENIDGTNLSAGIYNYLVIDANGCSQTFSVNIPQPQPLSVEGITSDLICFGEDDGQVILNITGGTPGYGENGNIEYQETWPVGVNPYALAPGFYTVDIEDVNGCTIEYSFNINDAIEEIVTLETGELEICENEEAVIQAPEGYTNYIWSNGYIGNPMYTDIEGDYYVEVENEDGCQLTSNTIELVVNTLPSTSNILGDPVVGINTANNYYVQYNMGSTYEWIIENNGGDIINGQGTNNVQISWEEVGYAIIYVTETNVLTDCEFTTSITVEVNDYTGIEELNNTSFSMFPNPLSQQDKLNINNTTAFNYNIKILDASGKIIYSMDEVESTTFSVPCTQFSKGLYIVNITSSEITEKKILIIQ